jgi:hypothetical protein
LSFPDVSPEPVLANDVTKRKATCCELHNDCPKFALFLLFSGGILQIAPAPSDFQ